MVSMTVRPVSAELLCTRPQRAEALSDDEHLTSDVCLSDCLVDRESRTERSRVTKIGTSHVTLAPLSRSNSQLAEGRDILWRPPVQLVRQRNEGG